LAACNYALINAAIERGEIWENHHHAQRIIKQLQDLLK
jgi:hypothetical protein